VDNQILQRIILLLLYLCPINAAKFPRFVSVAIVDTYVGKSERILLELGKVLNDERHLFEIRAKSIDTDEENPNVAWVDIEIHYLLAKKNVTSCVQLGKLCTNQIYRFENTRYIIGFDILPQLDDEEAS
jgi:hypothetical protein